MRSAKNNRKLRNYIINFSVQRKIIIINLLFILLVLIQTMAIIYTHMLEKKLGITGTWHFFFGDLSMSLTGKLFFLYALLAITFIFAVSTHLWMTNRICGALVNFTNIFRKIAEGDMQQRVLLRKDDLIKEEAEDFDVNIPVLSPERDGGGKCVKYCIPRVLAFVPAGEAAIIRKRAK